MKNVLLAAAAVALSVFAVSGFAQAATISTAQAVIDDFELVSPDVKPAARIRATNTGDEIYVGAGDLGTPANRSAAGFANLPASALFSIAYDAAATAIQGRVSAAVTGGTVATNRSASKLVAVEPISALKISITGPRTRIQSGVEQVNWFELSDLKLNGEALKDPSGATVSSFKGASSGARSTVSAIVFGFAKKPVFTLTGTVKYFGPQYNGSAEAAAVNVTFGRIIEATPVPVPAALPLLLSGLIGLGFVAWRGRRARPALAKEPAIV